MARKNRKKPFKCPIPGCEKRGQIADLKRHRDAVHPELLDPAGYIATIGRETWPTRPPGYYLKTGPVYGKPRSVSAAVAGISFALSIACIVGIVVFSWLAL